MVKKKASKTKMQKLEAVKKLLADEEFRKLVLAFFELSSNL